jgi:serine/threonine protein kinase
MASELSPVPNDLEFEATIRRLEVTQQVFERYQLLRILGRGGMGVVWLARDERLDRDVALKFLPDEIGLDPEAEDEMKRETRRCLELTHPNIIRIYDFVKDRQAAAISMEYIDGQTLSAVKIGKPRRVFEVDELRPWLTQACQALAYAHSDVGIIHRDLKPGNLMLTSRGQIKIADFGIAQGVSDSMARMTIRRGTSGTLSYMSPQQMNGEVSKVTDDVYAMGATIYELLTSKPPFHSGNVSFQLRVMFAPPMQERRDEFEIRGAEIPKEWEETIAACLGKTPEERPAGMQELAERLGLVRPRPRPPPLPAAKKISVAGRFAHRFQRALKFVRENFPRPDWKTFAPRKASLLVASTLVLSVLLGLVWEYVLWPQLATRAELRLDTSPPGATVHLPGYPDAVTPATLTKLRIGTYTVSISAEGFDPVQSTVQLKPGAKLDLGTITLQRAYGQWAITSLPSHCRYTLTGTAATGNYTRSGFTPELISRLPAGVYQLTLASPKFATYSETIQIPGHAMKAQEIDLIAAAIVGDSDDPAARAFRGMDASATLAGPDRDELIGYERRAFDLYIANGFLARAAQRIDALKKLNVDVTTLQAALDVKRAAKETDFSAAISKLVADHQFATAAGLLKAGEPELEKDSIARLQDRFQPVLVPYTQKINAALASLQGLAPDAAELLLTPLVAQYPDDLRLQLASARLLTQMPPNHDRLAAQLDAFRRLSDQDHALLTDPDLVKTSAALQDELQQLDALAKAQTDAKAALDAETAKIDRLKARKDAYENRRIGRPNSNPFASTLNFFGKVVTGHSVVDNEAYFTTRQQKEDAIADVQTQIDTELLTLPLLQSALDSAQKNYNTFAAAAPW